MTWGFVGLLAITGDAVWAGEFKIVEMWYRAHQGALSPSDWLVQVGAAAQYIGAVDTVDQNAGWLLQQFINDYIGDDLNDWGNPDASSYGLNGVGIPLEGFRIMATGAFLANLSMPKCDPRYPNEDIPVVYKGKAGVVIYHQFNPEIDISYLPAAAAPCRRYAVRGRLVGDNPGAALRDLDFLLSNNGTDRTRVWNGAFEFPRRLRDGDAYQVRVESQPLAQHHRCWIEERDRGGVIRSADAVVPVHCVHSCKSRRAVVRYPAGVAQSRSECLSPTFTAEGGGAVADPANDLLWMKATEEFADAYDARDRCLDLVLAGRSDWYLPDVAQLQTLLPPGTCHAALDGCGSGTPDDPAHNAVTWSRSGGVPEEYCPAGFGCYNSWWAVATGLGTRFGPDCNRPGCPPRERVYWQSVPYAGTMRCVADLHPAEYPPTITDDPSATIFTSDFESGATFDWSARAP